MILKFSNKITLNDWHLSGECSDPIWVRRGLPLDDYDRTILVSVRQHQWHKPFSDQLTCYANFYSSLSFLHNHFSQNIEGDLEFAKESVDKFLIRMSKLIAFL